MPPTLLKNPVGALFAAGVLAGAAVGIVDGVRAALLAHVDVLGLVACVALTAGLDLLVGALLGAGAGLLAFVSRWGRSVTPPGPARVLGWVVAGLLPAGAAAGAVSATAMRNNRFLAAGVVALAALGAGLVGALIGPAVGRLLGRGAEPRAAAPASWAGRLLAAPAVALVMAALVFVPVWYARSPLFGQRLLQLSLEAAAASALLPFALGWASGVGRRVPLVRAAAAAALLFGGPAVALVSTRWTKDFQFLRWNDVVVLAATALLGAGPGVRLVRARLARRALVLALGLSALGVLLVLGGSESEPARKAAAARAGLATPFLDTARAALDFDRDGYTRLLGGGDCNDGDPQINPGGLEWPDDGIDQNCDGKDASTAAIRSPPLHPVPEAVPRDLNLLLVTIDTLRADHLGAYGYPRPTSPQMDRLAAEGVVFENGWAHAPSTRYSMPAMATGRWPSAISWEDCAGCTDRSWPRIGASHQTIGEALKATGYSTAAYYAFSYFKREFRRGFERGIDDYQDQRADLHTDVNGPMESTGSSAREIADDAIAFFEKHPGGKWFLWLHFYDPHLDYQRHPEGPSFGASQVDLYDGEIWFTDHHLGRVLARLKELGQWDRTAVFVTGDHGEGFGEHGITAHGYHLYPPQTKVPFIARVPGLPARRVAAPVGHVDIAPTLLNLARGDHRKSFLGRSMLDLMTGAPSASVPLPPVFQDVTFEGPSSPIDGTRRRGLITGDRHLLWNWVPDNTTECYDVRKDPGETKDLWGTAAGAACAKDKAVLQDLVQVLSLPPDFTEKISFGLLPPGAPAPPPAHPLEARFGEAVRFLGYDLGPATVGRDGQVELVYHFEVVARVPEGWRPFFHLEGPAGFRNLDHVPLEGVYPVERWRPGQRLRDRQRIVITPNMPAGRYTIYTGFFRRSERLPVTPAQASDGANRLRVATFVVQ